MTTKHYGIFGSLPLSLFLSLVVTQTSCHNSNQNLNDATRRSSLAAYLQQFRPVSLTAFTRKWNYYRVGSITYLERQNVSALRYAQRGKFDHMTLIFVLQK
ncbi:hypothetical protein F5B21DRAFT_486746 [Xylaria acuta]|nr:hypothetical protein F5B21DRAFT_486746 [Xylaria acuta]